MNLNLRFCLNLIILMVVSCSMMAQALQGTYTIGGQGSTYPTFTSAVNALKTNGISGSVIFKVRAGNYPERIILTSFPGSSCNNTVTFESESGDSTLVSLVSPNNTSNYVVQLNGVDGIIFRKITIRSTTGIAIDIRGGSDCNQFLNNRLEGVKINSSGDDYAIVYTPYDQVSNNRNIFRNNQFENGSFGMRSYGLSNNHSSGLVVERNLFKDQSYVGVSVYYNDSVRIASNEIITENNTYDAYGIYLEGIAKGFQVIKNKISLLKGYFGIQLNNTDGTAVNKGQVINNFIKITGTANNFGIEEENADYVQIYNNTVSLNTTHTNKGYSIYYYGGTNLEVRNNIFANLGGGYAVYTNSTSAVTQSDFNDYYTTGTNLGYWNGNRADLAAWKAASAKDASSLSVNPLFKSATDLHVTQVDLNGKATPLSQVTDDIDGEPRSATNPDIGADEFTPAASDAGITQLNAPLIPFLHGSQTVKVTLKNYGAQPLTGATIRWQVNGQEQTPYNFSGSIASGATTTVEIGSYNFGLGIAYNFTLWTSAVNGVADAQPANDTTKANGIYAGMSGTYTIGGASPTFATIVAAADALNKGGVTGSVIFKVRSGIYSDQISLGAFPGTSCTNTVTFESESGDSSAVTLTGTGADYYNNYAVQLNGADGIIFRKLTLKAAYGIVIDVRGGSDCNQFVNSRLTGVKINSSSDEYMLVYSPGDQVPDHRNTFRNNLFEDGSSGISFSGSSANHENGTTLEGNSFKNQTYAGIRLHNSDSVRIASNEIKTENNTYDAYGIYLEGIAKGFQVIKNKISLLKGYYGIQLYNANGTAANKGQVINNFVKVTGTANNIGIGEYSADYVQIYNNNVSVSTTSASKGYSIYYSGGTNLEVRNNIFTNLGGGYAVYTNSTSAVTQSDFNNYYTTGTNLGYWNGNRADLAAWKAASAKDASSLSVNPLFKSATDLHVTQVDLNGRATPLSQVTDDIDGEPRSATNPDIGADEFTPAASDAGITQLNAPLIPFLHGSQTVRATIKNYGAQPLTGVTIHWQVNGQEQTAYNYTGTALAPGATAVVDIGSFSFGLGTAYNFTLWTSAPNGAADVQPANDTARANDLYAAMSGNYTVGGTSPTFTNFVLAADALNKGGVTGSVNFRVRPGTYPGKISLTAFPGTGCTNTVTFESESGDSSAVTLTGTGADYYNNYAVQLNGADGIIFRKLTLKAAYGIVIDVRGGSDCNQFVNSRLTGVKINSSSDEYMLVYSPGDQVPDHRNTFRNNLFEDGSLGISFSGSSANHENGTTLEGNSFKNQTYAGIRLHNSDSVRIASNEITTENNTYDAYGIYLEGIAKGFQVIKNKISLLKGYYGIQLYNTDGTAANKGQVINNFVKITGTANNIGIWEYNADHVQIFNNNVSVSTTNASKGFGMHYNGGTNQEIRNNIFANASGGYAVYAYSFPASSTSDYNDYYTMGANLGYWNGNRSDLVAWKTASGQDAHSLSVNPLFKSATDLHVTQVDLNGKATPLSQVTDDIDGEPRSATNPDIGADEFDNIARNIILDSMVLPKTGCGLNSSTIVKIRITNAGGQTETGFNVAYIMNNGTPVIENADTLNIPAGQSAYYSFKTPAAISKAGIYRFTVYVSLPEDQNLMNDTLKNIAIENIGVVQPVTLTLPANNATDLPLYGTNFSWSADSSATLYDFYLWKSTDPVPSTPTRSDLNVINYTHFSNLQYNTTYNWKVAAKNACSRVESQVSSFKTVGIPDLKVDTVIAPAEAVAGQNIEVSWRIRNTGNGGTGTQTWWDRVYLSNDKVYDGQGQPNADKALKDVANVSSLSAEGFYNQIQTLKLPVPPEIKDGDYYIIIVSDYYNYITEGDENNNAGVTVVPVRITTDPPPDLQVTQIVTPNNVLSGETRKISWTVKNTGQGITTASSWTDRIYFTRNAVFNASTVVTYADFSHNGNLLKDSTYIQNADIKIPDNIQGTFYIHVLTDAYKELVEFGTGGEDNNMRVSDSIKVFLTLPADLVVSKVTVPPTASAGQKITLNWTVKNQGSFSTTSAYWYDKVYLSISPVYEPNTAIPVGDKLHSGILAAGSSSDESFTVTLPAAVSARYYVYVITDAYSNVAEFVENNNTGKSDGLTDIRIPDLTVSSISIPAGAIPGAAVKVKWTVRNQGAGATNDAAWRERIILSTDSVYKPSGGTVYDFSFTNQTLATGDSVVREQNITLPFNVAGLFYVFVYADVYNDVYEDQYEGNNVHRNAGIINVGDGYPDIIVEDISLPPSAVASQPFQVQWKIKNNGPGSVINRIWTDYIYMSPTRDFAQAFYVGEKTVNASLNAAGTLTQSQAVAIPINKTGTYYVIIKTDVNNNVVEDVNENNNTEASSTTINVLPGPSADLQVSEILTASAANVNTNITVNYSVKNAGTGATASAYWNDRVYLSYSPVWNEANAIPLRSVSHRQSLPVNASYSVETTVTVPYNLSTGTYYMYVFTDADNMVYENTDESNNTGRSNAINVQGVPPVDLVTSNVNAPATGASGKTVNVQWRVDNTGSKLSLAYSWQDAVYLSDDPVFDPSKDRLLLQWSQVNPVNAQNYYTENRQVKLPEGVQGTYYLFAVADLNNANNDANYSNNYNLNRTNNIPEPVVISLSPSADLLISGLTVENGTAGQLLPVTYTVTNSGNGPTAAESWTDRIYISKNNTVEQADQLIGSFVRNGRLEVNGSYSPDISLQLPASLTEGNYFIIVQTDVNNSEYEAQAENNNYRFKDIFIATQTVTDLAVSNVVMPDSVVLGKKITIHWKTDNPGANTVNGLVKEAIYISADTLLDSTDVMIRTKDKHVNIASQGTYPDSITERITRVTPGEYYILVRTDLLNNFAETDEQNNLIFSIVKIEVSVPVLSLNMLQQDSLVNQQELYYRIDIPKSLEGESLVVTLNGDSLKGNNEVYLRYSLVPSRSQYDVAQETPFKGNQQVIIPVLREGAYYLMVFGSTTAGTGQNISITASILAFGITGVDAGKGGNTGLVTVKVTGSKFEPDMTFRFIDSTGKDSINAVSLYYINPTHVYASFNLKDRKQGLYSMETQNKAQQTARLNNAFRIVTGLTGGNAGGFSCSIVPEASGREMLLDTDAPESVRANRQLSFLIRYENTGDVDIPVPVRLLVSQRGAPIGFTVEELTQNKQELLLEMKEKNGPPNVLRPGAKGEIRIYSKSSAELSFQLLE